jgi:hypothetical protein
MKFFHIFVMFLSHIFVIFTMGQYFYFLIKISKKKHFKTKENFDQKINVLAQSENL